jgi:hypothetical protein
MSTGADFFNLWTPTQRGMAIVEYIFCVRGGPVSTATPDEVAGYYPAVDTAG